MKKETKRAVTFLMTLTFIVSSFFPSSISYGEEASAESVPPRTVLKDIDGHWGKKYIESAVTAGFIAGYEDRTFKPDQAVSRAEFITMVNNALQLRDENTVNLLFSDVRQTDWYYREIQKACYARYVNGISDHSFMPKKSITRQEAAVMLSRFLPKSGSEKTAPLDEYSDSAKISNWAKTAMALMTEKGYMTGNANGNLLPKGFLTRAEAAKIIGEMIKKETIVRENISVKNEGEILRGKIYVGDIVIEKSVGEGDATLENVSALSKVYILGGGANTVTLKDSVIVQLVVCKEGTKVRVLADGISVIHDAMVFNGNLIVNNQGQNLNAGEDGFQNIIYINGLISAETALQIAQEIAVRLDSTGRVTTAQVQQSIAAILPDSAATVSEGDSIVVTLQAAAETERGNKGSRTPPTAPGPPTDVRGSVKDGLPAVTFTEPASNGGSIITSYTVYAYDNGTLVSSSSGIAVPINISGLTTGELYTFKAVATNKVGTSTESAISESIILSEVNGKAAMLSSLSGNLCDCGLSTTAGGFEYTAEYYPDSTSIEPITGYAIHTEVQLQHLALHNNANAVLMNDLDFTGIASGTADPPTPMGALNAAVNVYGISYTGYSINNFLSGKFVPIGINTNPYTGTFSGNNKRITGLNISGSGVAYVGLFGYTSGALIKDFSLINGNTTGSYRVGGAVGYQSGGTIGAVHHTGTVTSVNGPVGGIVGWSTGMIIDCVNTGEVSGESHTGGIVGMSVGGTVKKCLNTGKISGNQNAVGGIAGAGQWGAVTDCWNTGPIMGDSHTGGVVGWSLAGEIINNSVNSGIVIVHSYYAGGIAGQSTGPVNALHNTGPVYCAARVGGIVGYNSPDASLGGAGQVRDSFNTGVVSAGTVTAVGGVVGLNRGSEAGNYWLNGTNLNGTAGVGDSTSGDTTTTFSAIDSVLDAIYASMSAIAVSAGGNEVGAIERIMTSDNTLPEFNVLQGSYVTTASSLTITVSAISDTTITVTSSTSPVALYLSAGDIVAPSAVSGGSGTYDLTGLDPGTWIMIEAVNTDPRLNRSYFIISH